MQVKDAMIVDMLASDDVQGLFNFLNYHYSVVGKKLSYDTNVNTYEYLYDLLCDQYFNYKSIDGTYYGNILAGVINKLWHIYV